MKTGTSDSTNSSLSPPSNGRLAELVRNRFEAALLSAGASEARPRIHDFLRDLAEPERSEVLCSLLFLELRHRIENGEQPILDEYLQQFPESAGRIKQIFQQTESGDPAQTSSQPTRAPITRDDAVENPTVSYVNGKAPAATTDGHVVNGNGNGAVPFGAQSTEPLAKSVRRRGETPLPNVPGYEIIEVVGRGGMGIVYKASDLKLKRLVALKMIDPEREHAPGPGDLERMIAEAQAVAQFGHPNIVNIHTIGAHEGRPYLVLEFLDGGNLAKKLGGVPQPPLAAAALVETLARTMEYAHQKKIGHRDLKPSNILLNADGAVKIADFGLAIRLDQDLDKDEDGFIVGTVFYMAPEQAWGKNTEVGSAADVYALGVILYEMLTGGPPLKAARRWDTVQLVRHAEPVGPRRLVPQVPLDLEVICLKCLKKAPRERYSAAELADELRLFQEGKPIKTRPPGIGERAWKWAKRQPALATSIGLAVLLGVIALGSLILHLERRAERAELELKKGEEIARLRDDVQTLHRQAQESFDQGLPREAQGRLQGAFALISAEPALDNLKPGLEALQHKVGGKLGADDKFQKFFALRDTALFNGMVLTGVDLKTNIKATQRACAAALQLFSDAQGAPAFPEFLPPEKKRECAAACYELLLVWADTESPEGAKGQSAALEHLERAARFRAPTQAWHLRRARFLKGPLAEAELRFAAGANAEGVLDYFLAGDAHLKAGRFKKAAEQFALAVRADPTHFWAWYMLAMCNLHTGELKLAREDFTTCLGYRKDLWYPYMSRGFANGQLNDFVAADQDYRQALALIALTPNRQAEYGIRVNLGDLRLKQARLVDGLVPIPWPAAFTPNLEFACRGAAEFARAESLAAAADLLNDARKLQPESYLAYLQLGLVRQQQNRLDDSADLFADAIGKAKNQEPVVRAHAYGQRARLRRQQQKLDLALADLDQALKLAPIAEDHVERGRILFAQQKLEQAVQAFDAALQLRSDEPEVYRFKAETLRLLKKDREAARALESYLAHRGRPTAEVYRMLGALRAKTGDSPKALQAYSNALQLQSDAATFTARGWVFLANESVPLAFADFEAAIRRDPQNAEAYAGRGLIHARQGNAVEALADANKARTHGGTEPPARLLWNIAHVYAQLAADPRTRAKQVAYQRRAIELLTEAIEQVPADERQDFWRDFVAPDDLLVGPLRGNVLFDSLDKVYGKKR